MLVWENLDQVRMFNPILKEMEDISVPAGPFVLSRLLRNSFKVWEYPFVYLWLEKLSEKLDLDRKLRVMDFGCGRSIFPEFLARKGFEVWGVDTDEHGYIAPFKENINKQYPNVIYWIGSVFDFDLCKFDAIISCSVLEHLIPQEFRVKVIRRLKELLESHGKMVHVVDFYFPEMLAGPGSRTDFYELGQIFGWDVGDPAMCPGSSIFDFNKIRGRINFILPIIQPIKPHKRLQARIAIGDDCE